MVTQAERIIRMEEKLDHLIGDMDELKKMLMGNGKPGLFKDVENIKLELAEKRGIKKTVLAIFGSGIVTSILTALSFKFLLPVGG